MSFDALTIGGLITIAASLAFMISVVRGNDGLTDRDS